MWGSDEYNVEGWKPLKRLPGHESGVLRFISYVKLPTDILRRCDRRRMGTSRSISSLCGLRLESHYMGRIYPRSVLLPSYFIPVMHADKTSESVRKIDQHQGFVKGVTWDPVGEYLATQSDDRSVKIWRTTDWQMEAEVRKPFADSPGSTFFRRLR